VFKTQIELEKAQGHRGPATRLFGPLGTLWEAQQAIRDACIALFVLAALLMVLAFWSNGLLMIPDLLTGSASAAVLTWRHRFVAVVLLLSVLGSWWIVLWVARGLPAMAVLVAMLVLAVRASRATFLVHAYRQARSAIDRAPRTSAEQRGAP
jgi:hypothetical protein